ncbi:MAG: hypothetical protein UV24_C0033G0004, partial [Candidatus Nomurabacteria bacterium GW2011_GWA2_42_41]
LASPPPTPPPRSGKRNGKEIFGFASPFQSPKRASLFYHILIALFSALTATEAHSYPRLVVALPSANHTQSPSHSPLAFARAGCFGVVCVRLVASKEFSGNSIKRFALSASKSICACPTHPVRTQKSARYAYGSLLFFLVCCFQQVFKLTPKLFLSI